MTRRTAFAPLLAAVATVVAVAVVPTAMPAQAGAAARAPGAARSVVARSTPPGLPYPWLRRDGYQVRTPPTDAWPYWGAAPGTLVSLTVTVKGRAYLHPVAFAADGYVWLDRYRHSHAAGDLAQAVALGRRLVAQRVVVGQAWFLRHDYPFFRHRNPADPMPRPFYSAMAQGEALGFLTRLAEVTGVPAWRTAADHVFAAFLLPRAVGRPWVVDRDAGGYLWLEEWPAARPDRTFNGHMFAAFGLWDYARATGDARAAALFDAALTTVRRYFGAYRVPGWVSRYCLLHGVQSAGYHRVHVQLLLKLAAVTGNPVFDRMSDLLEADYPSTAVTRGVAYLAPGLVRAYSADPKGHVTGSRLVRLPVARLLGADARSRLSGRGIFLRITGLPLRGLWVAESSAAYLRGAATISRYVPLRGVSVAPGAVVTAVRLAANGTVAAQLRGSATTVGAGGRTVTDARGIVLGRRAVELVTGPWAGAWLLLDAGVSLD